MAVKRVVDGAIANTLPPSPTAMTVVPTSHKPMFVVYDAGSDTAFAYSFDAGTTEFSASANFIIGTGWDIVEGFVLNDVPWLVCYRQSAPTLTFFKLVTPMANPVAIPLAKAPGMAQALTTIKAFPVSKGTSFLGYNQADGGVGMYSFLATGSQPANVWSHQWARGWTHFALFQFGGATFFFKINVVKPNVNIDHVLDGLTTGTVEVGTDLALANAQDLTIVEPVTLSNGDPHFVTYEADGTATLNRFNGNCLGWTQLAIWKSLPNATHLMPFESGSETFLLFV